MKIGVTGASGLVGYNVCKEILANGDSLKSADKRRCELS